MFHEGALPGWKNYELLGLMHGKYTAFGQGGYSPLMTLCEMGVRLSDVLDHKIRPKIPLSPKKAKILFEMVESLGPEKCQDLCNDANLYHLTISERHPISFAALEHSILRHKFSILDLSTMTFLEFRDTTTGGGQLQSFQEDTTCHPGATTPRFISFFS